VQSYFSRLLRWRHSSFQFAWLIRICRNLEVVVEPHPFTSGMVLPTWLFSFSRVYGSHLFGWLFAPIWPVTVRFGKRFLMHLKGQAPWPFPFPFWDYSVVIFC